MVTRSTFVPSRKGPQRVKKLDKQFVEELNYQEIDFRASQKQYNKVEVQNNIRINVFGYEDKQPFPIHIFKETFEDQMNLLLITKGNRNHYVLIKDFNAFMFNQTKNKNKNKKTFLHVLPTMLLVRKRSIQSY